MLQRPLNLWLFEAFAITCCSSVAWALGCCCGDECTSPVFQTPCPTTTCPPPLPCSTTPISAQSQIITAVCKPVECPQLNTCPPVPECPAPDPCEPCPECPSLPPPPAPCASCLCQQPAVIPCSGFTWASIDCCHGCSNNSGCCVCHRRRFRNRSRYHKKTRKSKRFSRYIRGITIDDDPTCNNHALRRLMYSNISGDVSETKRVIQRLAEYEFKQNFNVICSTGSFAYVVHSNVYCQASINGIHCYAFSF